MCDLFPVGYAFARGKKTPVSGFSDQIMLLNSRELCRQFIPTNLDTFKVDICNSVPSLHHRR